MRMLPPVILLDRPCQTEDARFEPRDGGVYCHSCQQMQYDLRDATRAEVLALIDASGGRVCGQLRLGPSGEPRFKPEPPPRALTTLRTAAMAVALAACGSPSEPEPTIVAEIPVAPPPPPTTTTQAEPPPPTTTTTGEPPATDVIDHSTDDSTNLSDHRAHVHTHRVTGSGTGHVSYRGGLARAPDPDDEAMNGL